MTNLIFLIFLVDFSAQQTALRGPKLWVSPLFITFTLFWCSSYWKFTLEMIFECTVLLLGSCYSEFKFLFQICDRAGVWPRSYNLFEWRSVLRAVCKGWGVLWPAVKTVRRACKFKYRATTSERGYIFPWFKTFFTCTLLDKTKWNRSQKFSLNLLVC